MPKHSLYLLAEVLQLHFFPIKQIDTQSNFNPVEPSLVTMLQFGCLVLICITWNQTRNIFFLCVYTNISQIHYISWVFFGCSSGFVEIQESAYNRNLSDTYMCRSFCKCCIVIYVSCGSKGRYETSFDLQNLGTQLCNFSTLKYTWKTISDISLKVYCTFKVTVCEICLQ